MCGINNLLANREPRIIAHTKDTRALTPCLTPCVIPWPTPCLTLTLVATLVSRRVSPLALSHPSSHLCHHRSQQEKEKPRQEHSRARASSGGFEPCPAGWSADTRRGLRSQYRVQAGDGCTVLLYHAGVAGGRHTNAPNTGVVDIGNSKYSNSTHMYVQNNLKPWIVGPVPLPEPIAGVTAVAT